MQLRGHSEVVAEEQKVYDELGPQGFRRLGRDLHRNEFYDTEQRALGVMSKAFNSECSNRLPFGIWRALIRAGRGRAAWLDEMILYRAEVQREYAAQPERRMARVRRARLDDEQTG